MLSTSIDLLPPDPGCSVDAEIFIDDGVNSYVSLTAVNVDNLNDGVLAYIKPQQSYWQLISMQAADGIIADRVIASSDPNRYWYRVAKPSMGWANQYFWHYDAVNGNNLNNGLTKATSVKSLQELAFRWTYFQVGNGNDLIVQLHSPVPSTDSYVLSGLIQSSGQQLSTGTFVPGIFGYRTKFVVPGGTGLIADATNAQDVDNTKATFIDSAASFATSVGKLIAWPEGPLSGGVVGQIISNVGGVVTFETNAPGTFFIPDSFDTLITLYAAGGNTGTFPLLEVLSDSRCTFSNPSATPASGLSWTNDVPVLANILTAPSFTSGTFTGLTAVLAATAQVTFSGAPASTFLASDIGKRFRAARVTPGPESATNNADYTILSIIGGGTGVVAAQVTVGGTYVQPVIDAAAPYTFVGVVETSEWFSESALGRSAAPAPGTPYVVVSATDFGSRVSTVGLPKSMRLQFFNCNFTQPVGGVDSGGTVELNFCTIRGFNGMLPGRSNNQPCGSSVIATQTCWISPAPFLTLTMQEGGKIRLFFSSSIGYNWQVREPDVFFLGSASFVQGGYFGNPVIGGSRPGALSIVVDSLTAGGGLGFGVFNNINGSSNNPTVAINPDSVGAAYIFGRGSSVINAGSAAGFIFGIGKNIGLHLKESSRLLLGSSRLPAVTNSAGSAKDGSVPGSRVGEFKLDDGAVVCPTYNPATGLPIAGVAPVTTWLDLVVGYGGNIVNPTTLTQVCLVSEI